MYWYSTGWFSFCLLQSGGCAVSPQIRQRKLSANNTISDAAVRAYAGFQYAGARVAVAA